MPLHLDTVCAEPIAGTTCALPINHPGKHEPPDIETRIEAAHDQAALLNEPAELGPDADFTAGGVWFDWCGDTATHDEHRLPDRGNTWCKGTHVLGPTTRYCGAPSPAADPTDRVTLCSFAPHTSATKHSWAPDLDTGWYVAPDLRPNNAPEPTYAFRTPDPLQSVTVTADDGRVLLAIHRDGTVTADLDDVQPAAAQLLAHLERMMGGTFLSWDEVRDLREHAEAVLELLPDSREVAERIVTRHAPDAAAPPGPLEPNPPCPAALDVAGQHYPCTQMDDMVTGSNGHDGWAHSNAEAQAIWTEDAQALKAAWAGAEEAGR